LPAVDAILIPLPRAQLDDLDWLREFRWACLRGDTRFQCSVSALSSASAVSARSGRSTSCSPSAAKPAISTASQYD
jgi:hypothetical protein